MARPHHRGRLLRGPYPEVSAVPDVPVVADSRLPRGRASCEALADANSVFFDNEENQALLRAHGCTDERYIPVTASFYAHRNPNLWAPLFLAHHADPDHFIGICITSVTQIPIKMIRVGAIPSDLAPNASRRVRSHYVDARRSWREA